MRKKQVLPPVCEGSLLFSLYGVRKCYTSVDFLIKILYNRNVITAITVCGIEEVEMKRIILAILSLLLLPIASCTLQNKDDYQDSIQMSTADTSGRETTIAESTAEESIVTQTTVQPTDTISPIETGFPNEAESDGTKRY